MSADRPFVQLLRRLAQRDVRYVVIGVAGANYYARSAVQAFSTKDRDLFLPPDTSSLLNAWNASRESGYELWSGDEPLGEPLDRWLGDRVVSTRANTTAIHPAGVAVDFTLEMKGFDFETAWDGRRLFRVDVATWEETLRDLLKEEE